MIIINYSSTYSFQKPTSEEKYNIGVFNTNMDLIDSALNRIEKKNESQDDLLATKDSLNEHISDKNNPHEITKFQINLGNVDNTSDKDKPVSIAQQNVIDNALYQSNYYTDTKIAELINGAPETLDTLKEIAEAFAENDKIIEAINESIGKKADQIELDIHTENDIIHVLQSDKDNWNAAKKHADSNHARIDATKVEKSDTNGNIKINGIETKVYIPQELTKEIIITVLGYTPSDENSSTNGIIYSDIEPAYLIKNMTWIGN